MNDLFTSNEKGRYCIHLATESVMVVKRALYINGNLHYHCLVPQKDNKGKPIFCDATYSQDEIFLTDVWFKPKYPATT